ncbi:hypothetical protein I5677_09535 [Mobilitalea sibirica]|uniref:Uncharacterized protein n=1 Tax=Mobilitalea sibirica TaxID=1462919 RepID=A0A8J7H7E8_9FIRM|nr:hypothetical protein [Mobilitalea sibirica]MBH1941131.1 hypothetical protein [Mobilitalea sibirica]
MFPLANNVFLSAEHVFSGSKVIVSSVKDISLAIEEIEELEIQSRSFGSIVNVIKAGNFH